MYDLYLCCSDCSEFVLALVWMLTLVVLGGSEPE